jgi:hypothetical protein
MRTNFSAAGVSHTSIEGGEVADPCYVSLKLQQLFIFLLCAGVSHTSIEDGGVADPCYMSLKLQQLFIFLLCIKR